MSDVAPADTFQLTTSPVALPGCCFFCGGTPGDGVRECVVDTARYVDFHGQMYVCDICVLEIARLFDFVSPSEAAALRAKVDELEALNFQKALAIDGLERAIHGLTSARDALGGGDPVHPPDLDDDDVVDEDHESDSDGAGDTPSEGAGDMASGEGNAPEPVHDEGVDLVRPDGRSAEFSLDL